MLVGFIYNQLACQRNMVKEYFSRLDVHFQYRHNFLPLLLNVAEPYIKREKELLEKIYSQIKESQSAYFLREKAPAENNLTNSLNILFLKIKNCAPLQKDETFESLQKQLLHIEDKIQTSKRQYNSAVRMYNDLISIVPHKFFAKFLGFKEANYFEIESLNDTKDKI